METEWGQEKPSVKAELDNKRRSLESKRIIEVLSKEKKNEKTQKIAVLGRSPGYWEREIIAKKMLVTTPKSAYVSKSLY